MNELSSDAISHLGHLARVELTAEESTRFAGQLSSVVKYIEQLSQVDTSAITQIKGVTGMHNVLAADRERTPTDPCAVSRDELLSGAPAHVEGYIEVRAVLGDGDEVVSA